MSVVLIIAAVAAGLFLLTLVMYFFNLDMKAAAMLQPLFTRHYDRMKRDRRL